MVDVRIETIRAWPKELTVDRRNSPFSYKTTPTQTMDLLDGELDKVGAQAVVLQLAIDRSDLRLSGSLRSNIKPEHPGVILTFTSPKLGKVRFSTDRFLRWEDNLRAIALGMEALRKVDRYGITGDNEQYAGFKALEAAAGATGFDSPEAAANYLVRIALDGAEDEKVERLAEAVLDDVELVDTYYRRASKIAHPDVAGGNAKVMARLNAARAVLEEHMEAAVG